MKGLPLNAKTSPISFLDLEMTGLEASKHEILEAGLVKVSQPTLEIIETWEAKVKPENIEDADPEAMKFNNYNEDAWKDAISLKEMMEILSKKLDGTILAGSNISCDYAFLDVAVTKTGVLLNIHRRTLDVNSYAHGKGYDLSSIGMDSLLAQLDLKNENRHSALADAMAVYEIYKKLILA